MLKRKNKREELKLSENSLVLFKRAVLKLPYDNIDDTEIQRLLKVVKHVLLESTERLIVKGSKSLGLYVVVSGQVEAISNGGIALRVVKKGDFFGDVSTLFDTASPVTVRAYEGTDLLLIKSQDFFTVLPEKPKISLFQWFLKRKYIDTARLFQDHALMKELAYQSLHETPMFHNWSSDCLHFLVEQALPEVLILFPAGSYICREDDHAREIFILVHGAAKLLTDKQEHVPISASNSSFCMGEEAFFNQLKRNCDIRAETPCLVLIVNKEHLDHLFDSDIPCIEEQGLHQSLSSQWKTIFTARQNKSVYSKYRGQLELEVISILLWRALQQRGLSIPFSAGFFHALYLSMTASEVEVGKDILAASELYDVAVMLMTGCGELYSGNQSTGNIQAVGLYLPNADVPSGSWIKATNTSLVIKIPASVIKKAQEQYPEGFPFV